jgi:hypothetical protein
LAEQVLLAVPSWTPDKNDGGVYVALPLACSDCTIRSTELPFSDCDPFQRGVLMFLLAGVKHIDELAGLLGITDAAFVRLMVDELQTRELVQRGSHGDVLLTQKARDIYKSAPGSISQQRYGRVLYFHDGTRGYVVAGPLDQDSRYETIEELEGGVGRISVGTEGKPLYAECVTPRIPSGRPKPIQSDDAQIGITDFVRITRNRSSIARGVPKENFTVSLQEPRWERLLVRVVSASSGRQETRRKQGRSSDLSTLIGESMQSPHALRQLLDLQQSDDQLKEAISRRVVRPSPRTKKFEEKTDPLQPTLREPPATVDHELTEQPTIVDTSLTAELCRALRDRSSLVSADRHVPLVEDRVTTDATLRDRFRLVGFTTTDAKGVETPFPHIPDDVIAHVRHCEWDSVTHLWAAFCGWTLTDEVDAVEPAAILVPDLPSVIAEAHWGRYGAHHDELHHLLEHLNSLREEPT